MQSWTDLPAWSWRKKKVLTIWLHSQPGEGQKNTHRFTGLQNCSDQGKKTFQKSSIKALERRNHINQNSWHVHLYTMQCWFHIKTSHNYKPYPSTSTKCQCWVILTPKMTITDICNTTNIRYAVASAVVYGRQRHSLQQHSLASYTFH